MSKKTKAIIVDDEESARHILKSLLERIAPDIEIVTSCPNLVEAVLAINKYEPELVFLDIEMPKYAGYEISSFFDEMDFNIIFVTAYDHYAIKAFEVAAVDYILKPISIDRLSEALDKFRDKVNHTEASLNYKLMLESLESNSIQKIIVPTNKGQKVILLDDIISIEANRAYSTIFTIQNDSYLLSKNLRQFEELFKENTNFVRCHKSWIINTKYMESYSKSELNIYLENGKVAKLSKYKKAEFEAMIS